MSVSTEVQRTLVKSPPELWAELGNPDGLARHLGEIGEIRVTRVEPESKVEWEADRASGVVQLKQSGWGTKVTLSLTRELPGAENASGSAPDAAAECESAAESIADPQPEPGVAVESTAEPETEAVPSAPKPETEAVADVPEPEPEPEPVAETLPQPAAPEPAIEAPPESAAAACEPAPKKGFFARLFKRRQPPLVATGAAVEQEPAREPASAPEPAVEPQALALPEPIYPDPPPTPVQPELSADLAAELAELEAQMQQESAELLTRVLDRLGAAHHRPFSRG